jgi:hypothetical protein
MEDRPDRAENVTAPDSGSRGRFYAYAIAAVGAVLAAVALAVVLLWPEDTSSQSSSHAGAILFAEIHATLLVDPGVAGANSVEIEIARHDGAPPEVRGVVLTVRNPSDGTSLGEFDARPVEVSPGTFRVSNLTIPTPGDWEFALGISQREETLSDSTLITIGAQSSAG